MTLIVTREYLASLLDAWQQDKITTLELYETAEKLYFSDKIKVLDMEGEDEISVTIEVLDYLDSLHINFITKDDIGPCKEFLQTKIGHFEEGSNKWNKYLKSINYSDRANLLKGQIPYIID